MKLNFDLEEFLLAFIIGGCWLILIFAVIAWLFFPSPNP